MLHTRSANAGDLAPLLAAPIARLCSVQKVLPTGGPPLGSARRSPGLPFHSCSPCLGAVLFGARTAETDYARVRCLEISPCRGPYFCGRVRQLCKLGSAGAVTCVGCGGKTGQHLLAVSSSHFDPKRSSAPLTGCKIPTIPPDRSSPIRYPASGPRS